MRGVLVLCLVSLGGCANAPASPTGPMLPKGPLHGRLEQGNYHDMRGWFGVTTPLSPRDPDYASLAVNEEYRPNISFVSFIPTHAPGEFYRVYVEDFYGGNHPVTGLSQIADSAMKFFGAGVAQDRSEPIRQVGEKPWQTATSSGLLRLYTERTPIEPLLANLGLAEDYTAYILMYVAAEKGKVAVLWMEWPMDCKPCVPLVPGPATTSQDPIDQALADNGRTGQFIDSFHFGND